MAVLFSELLVPGWAEGSMIGLGDVTGDVSLPCHNAEPELFFDETPSRIALAKSLCGGCPMKSACLEGAMSRKEPCGVWGGELFVEGEVVSAKRSVGRPRLNPVIVTELVAPVSVAEVNGECESDDEALAS
jgi:WhiB family redox-sensing transcriptional regulator